jgi:deoxyuridine 5'-triphosphate nucleotidohydrolase
MLSKPLKAFIYTIVKLWKRCLDAIGVIDVLYYTGVKPYRKYGGDAGYDLVVFSDTTIPSHIGVDVPVDTIITSRRCWLMLIGRSSTFFNKGLLINTAIIDNGYSAPLRMFVYNPSNKNIKVKRGERIGQVIPFRLERTCLLEGRISKKGQRGNKGFGSTGI